AWLSCLIETQGNKACRKNLRKKNFDSGKVVLNQDDIDKAAREAAEEIAEEATEEAVEDAIDTGTRALSKKVIASAAGSVAGLVELASGIVGSLDGGVIQYITYDRRATEYIAFATPIR